MRPQHLCLLLSSKNVFSAVVTIMMCCSGPLTLLKAQGLLLMSLVVIVVNLINLVILEVGEWRGFLSQQDKDFIEENGLENLMYKGKDISNQKNQKNS